MYEKFAELLEKTNKTAYQVSKDTGIAQSVLADWKRGKIKIIGADKLKILANYFGVSIEYFLDDGPEKEEDVKTDKALDSMDGDSRKEINGKRISCS